MEGPYETSFRVDVHQSSFGGDGLVNVWFFVYMLCICVCSCRVRTTELRDVCM
eukprot:JP436337.1.p4 GENE.JP436337.1~~JP436337.1.p4  ORF type:complete len:53 (-),score=0.20 JP436337.1:324-482(-)